MAGNLGNLALDGGDPRVDTVAGVGTKGLDLTPTRVEIKRSHDPSVTFEEYLHYAKISRADARYEDQDFSLSLFKKERRLDAVPVEETPSSTDRISNEKIANEKDISISGDSPQRDAAPSYGAATEQDYVTASRAARNATWGAVFYLITTDILGPFSTPWAFSKLGYGPSVVLYTIFGAFAGYGGYLLWRLFLGMDSDRHPLQTYGDIAFRIFGRVSRHCVNALQSVQLLFNVGIIIIVNGQSLSQVASGRGCFIILCFVWAIAGALVGQIRTLQRLGWLANAAIWINLVVIFFTVGIVASSPPNYVAGLASNFVPQGPVVVTAGPPAGVEFQEQVVGLGQAVYSYGGAMLFVEFMAEMRRPWDFWKGMMCAQLFIFFFYMFFGLFVYSFQGQFSINPAYQGISSYAWQTTANVLGLVSGLIAALLYGNIGIKVIYNNVLIDLFHFPALTTKKGKLIWVGCVPAYWSIAFVICAAIPQVSNLSGLIASACILQFSYTFPPMFMLGYQIKKDAMVDGEGFDPATRQTVRHDSGFTRWRRGYMKHWAFNTFNLIFFLGSATTAVLGIYSAIVSIISSYGAGSPPSFSCNSPIA